MNNVALLVLVATLSACGPAKVPEGGKAVVSSYVPPQPSPQMASEASVEHASQPKSDHSEVEFEQAIQCWALADIVDTLVNADVIKEVAIRRYSGRAKGVWQDRAVALGGARGLAQSAIHSTFENQQFELLVPLRSLSQSAAAEHIEGLVRATGDCDL